MKNVVFLGAKRIGHACLSILKSWHGTEFNIVGVLTNARGDAIRELADDLGVPVIPSLDAYASLADHVDVAISVQYHEILKPVHVQKASDITVNLHMAPLPEYRGCNQFSFAIIDEAKVFGTTLHRIVPGIDSGPILAERRFEVPEGRWVEDLYELTFEHSVELFQSEILGIIEGERHETSQAELEDERGSSFHLRKEIADIKLIDLDWSREKIERHIRATSMSGFEPPYAMIGGVKVHLATEQSGGVT